MNDDELKDSTQNGISDLLSVARNLAAAVVVLFQPGLKG